MAKPDDLKPPASTAPETVTIPIEHLRTLLAEARAPEPPRSQTLDEAFEAHQRMMHEARTRVPVSWYVAGVSRETGAKFVAYVSASRRHAGGRVISLPHYEYPEGSDRSRANGGICDMNEITDQHGQPTPMFKQWRYASFWKQDLRSHVGADARLLQALGPARPTLEDAKADLAEAAARPPETQNPEPSIPTIVARAPAP